MLTMNFPNKVFERRTKALKRLKSSKIGEKGSRLSKLPEMEPEILESLRKNREKTIKQEIESLENSLRIVGSPRNLHSKKDRTGRAKISHK